MTTQQSPYTFDRVVRIILTVVSIVGMFYILDLLKGALLPFAVAWLVAYLLNPMVLLFERRIFRGNRALGIIATLFTLVTIFTILGATLLPSIIKEINHTVEVIHGITKSENFAPISQRAWYQSLVGLIDLEQISKLLNPEEWKTLVENLITHAWSIFSGSVNQIINIVGWFIVLLYLIFILLDYEKIAIGFRRLIPEQYRDITLTIIGDVERGMNRYFRGQSLIALIVGVLFSLGFVLVGLPLAIPVGIFIGILNLVPYLQVIGFIPVILLCLLDSYTGGQSFWILFGYVMIVFAVVQAFQDIILVPKIMGRVTGFSPAVILLSLSVWGTLLGMLGMIIALPITSLLVSYYQKYILLEKEESSADTTPTEDSQIDT